MRPVFKAVSPYDIPNYRLISILPIINKIFEKVIYRNVLKSSNFFYAHQYVFKAKCGTHTALFELINNINLDVDNKKLVTGIFLDLAKAFDSFDHCLLLNKLETAGIRGIAQNLFRSYLRNRFQYVSDNDVKVKALE